MSHVDEGALHAYLDGALDDYPTGEARRIRAHLERCASCSAALAEARSLRDAAEAVLATPTLNVTPPPLEELRLLARSGEGTGAGASAWPLGSRLYRLGWAASVVLALGIGWTVRGGGPVASPTADAGRTASSEMAGPSESPSAAPADAVEEQAAGSGARGSVADRPRADEAEAERLADRAPVADTPVPVAARTPLAAAAPPARVAGVTEASDTGAFTRDEAVEGQRLAEAAIPGRAEASPDAAEPALPVPVVTDAVEQDSRKVAVAAVPAADSPAGAVGSPAAPAAADAGAGASGNAGESRSTLAARSDVVGIGLAPARMDSRQRASEAVAREVEDGAEPGSLVVPGLEVLSIVWREEGVTPGGVRVLQRLEDGGVLELIHLPEGVAPDSVEPEAPGTSQLIVPREQGWLILRGPLSEAELAALLARLEAPGPA